MTRRVTAIVNPVSGRRNMLPVVRAIGHILEREGWALDVLLTDCPGHAIELARAVPDDTHAVLAVGGDGTVCEVINGLYPRNIPLVILRTGTENLLARELGMPTEPLQVARTLLYGEPRPLDVGVLNDRRFLAVAGVGFDAECVIRLARVRRGHITHGDYFWPIWRTFWAHRFPELRIEADGELVFTGRGLALIGVIRQYSVGLRILSSARYDDGLLDLCVFPCASRIDLMGHATRAFMRRHVGRGGVIYRQCREVRIESPDRVPVELDGDLGGQLPADCTIQPAAARFLRLP